MELLNGGKTNVSHYRKHRNRTRAKIKKSEIIPLDGLTEERNIAKYNTWCTKRRT